MTSQKTKHKSFSRAAVALTALGASATGTALVLSWTTPQFNTDGSPLTNLGGYKVNYGTSPGTTDPGSYSNSIDVGTATSVDMPPDLFVANTPYYFCIAAYNATGTQSQCSNTGTGTPNEVGPPAPPPSGGGSVVSWVDTRVAMWVPGVTPAQVYIFSVNTIGGVSPVVQDSTGGYAPVGYSAEEDGTARLTAVKPSVNAMVWELGIASNMARGSSTVAYSATTGNIVNDSRAYTSESLHAYRLYATPQGEISLQYLNSLDFGGTIFGPFHTYPSATTNSVENNGVTTTKIAKEIRSDANQVALLAITYNGGVDDQAVAIWTIPEPMLVPLSAAGITDATLPSYINQSYLAPKSDANGFYNYNSMGISGGAAAPVLNVAYTQTTSQQVKVVIDQYAGSNYPGSYAAGQPSHGPKPTCTSPAYTFPAGTTLRFDIQGDQLGRLWAQNGTALAYVLTDTTNCNASAGMYNLTRPTGVPAAAVLVPNGF